MQAHPLRLFPGDDLRAALEDVLRQGRKAKFGYLNYQPHDS
jgi:hypothetical protein